VVVLSTKAFFFELHECEQDLDLDPQHPAVCPLQEVNVKKALAINIPDLILLFIFTFF
jgi:hypothetical protein